MSLDEFEDILEKIPGKTNTAKMRYVLQFYFEIIEGRKVSVIQKDANGEQKVLTGYYSERLENLYLKMCNRLSRDLNLPMEMIREIGILEDI